MKDCVLKPVELDRESGQWINNRLNIDTENHNALIETLDLPKEIMVILEDPEIPEGLKNLIRDSLGNSQWLQEECPNYQTEKRKVFHE